MITEKDLTIIAHLRKDARKKVTHISREMNLPVTTVYDKLKAHERKGIIKKHVCLLDYRKLGYHASAMVAFKIDPEKRAELMAYLADHKNVNSLYRVDFGHDALADVVFEDMSMLQDFVEETKAKFNMSYPTVFNILQEVKREEFLS